MKYFAITLNEQIVPLGECRDIGEAIEKEPIDTFWLCNEDGLRNLRDKIEGELE